MTNRQKIEEWLDKQIEAGILGENLKINKSLTLCNASARSYIQLYGCLHQIAKILELEVIQSEPSRLPSGKLYAEDHFFYKGVMFLEVVS